MTFDKLFRNQMVNFQMYKLRINVAPIRGLHAAGDKSDANLDDRRSRRTVSRELLRY